MFNQPSFQNMHPLIKRIIACSLLTTLACVFLKVFLVQTLHLPPPAILLSISPWGAKHGAIYQVLTYPFVNSLAYAPLSIWSLLGAFFQYYIVFSIGTAFIYQRGVKSFLTLFFGSSILTGLVAFSLMIITGSSSTLITGLSHPIMAMLTWFAFHQPNAQILIFFFPVRAKWAIFGLTAIYLFLDFSNGLFINFASTLTTFLYAYLYSILSSESVGPFDLLHPAERQIISIKRKLSPILNKDNSSGGSKIQDLYQTKRQVKKDLYLDLLLEKISKKGKQSLSWKEKLFLFRYSK